MKAGEIFLNLCNFRNQTGGISPEDLEKKGVTIKDITSEKTSSDLISCKKYIGEDGKAVQEDIISYDHSRTYEPRPDTNHFRITLLETGESRHYMTIDDFQ